MLDDTHANAQAEKGHIAPLKKLRAIKSLLVPELSDSSDQRVVK